MSDYNEILLDLPSDTRSGIKKSLDVYISSFVAKQSFKSCFDRHLSYFENGEHRLPFTKVQLQNAFRAKDFFKDLGDCGSWLEFRYWVDHDKTKLHHANFCKRDKICPACAVRRAYKQQSKFLSIIEENPSLIDRDWYYIVIPVKHSKKDSFEKVLSYVEQIRKRMTKQMRNGRSGLTDGFFTRFFGGMYSIEVTYSDNGWNVHMNLLVSAPKGLVPLHLKKHTHIWKGKEKSTFSSPDLSDWLRQFNGSHINSISKLNFFTRDEIVSNLVEIFKYSLKFSSLTDQKLLEVFIKTKGKRLFGTFGDLWGKGLESVPLDGDTNLTGDFVELIFHRVLDGSFPDYLLYKRETKTQKD